MSTKNSNKTNKSKKNVKTSDADQIAILGARDLFGNSTGRYRSHAINRVCYVLCQRENGATCAEIATAFRELAKSENKYHETDDAFDVTEKTIASVRAHLTYLVVQKQILTLENRVYKLSAETIERLRATK